MEMHEAAILMPSKPRIPTEEGHGGGGYSSIAVCS